MTATDIWKTIADCALQSFTSKPPGGESYRVIEVPHSMFIDLETGGWKQPFRVETDPPILCRITATYDDPGHRRSSLKLEYTPGAVAPETPTVDQLITIIRKLRTGDCWCECGVDNPMMGGKHTTLCLEIQKLIGK